MCRTKLKHKHGRGTSKLARRVNGCPRTFKFAVKMIVHEGSSQVGKIDFKGSDLPAENVIIEEGEPVATVVNSSRILRMLFILEKQVDAVYAI